MDGNRLIAEQMAYDVAGQAEQANIRIAQLNEGQRAAFDTIMNAVTENNPQLFFCMDQQVLGKPFVIIHSVMHFVDKARLFYVLHHQGLQHFF